MYKNIELLLKIDKNMLKISNYSLLGCLARIQYIDRDALVGPANEHLRHIVLNSHCPA